MKSAAIAGAGCFVAGTEVHTANGPVPIEQLTLDGGKRRPDTWKER